MEHNKTAIFLNWIGKTKLRRFAGWLVICIIFDGLFGYISHSGWPRHSWTHFIFYSVPMALWLTVLSIYGGGREIDW
jgi:hypothetical protein